MKKFITLISLVIIALWTIPGTYSWICNNYYKNTIVSAAKEENIIEKVEILEFNPENLILKKEQGLNYTPVIFFNIDGEINSYIHGINPVKLGEEDEIIPLTFVFGPSEVLNLLSGNEIITGTISIKHLNEYISIDKKIIFTKKFLLEKLLEQVQLCQNKINEQQIIDMKEYLQKNNIYFDYNCFIQNQNPLDYSNKNNS